MICIAIGLAFGLAALVFFTVAGVLANKENKENRG